MYKPQTLSHRRIGVSTTFAASLALGLGLLHPAGAQTYGVRNLGTLGGNSQAFGLAASGVATGYSLLTNGNTHAFLSTGGAPQDLGTLGGGNSYGNAVASTATGASYAVGYSDLTNGFTQHAFISTTTGGLQDLGTLSGTSTDNSAAYGVNTLRQVVGSSINNVGQQHAFRTNVGGTALTSANDLGTLGGVSTAFGINASGQVVGTSNLSDDVAHAFRTAANGAITSASDLGTLGGDSSAASAINDLGQVVGDSTLAGDNDDHAFLWTQGATTGVTSNVQMRDLGTLGGSYSVANGINNLGQVVGFSVLANGTDTDAFLYRNGQMIDLNSLISPTSGWVLQYASAINDSGMIAGYGQYMGNTRAFLLTPSPEPSPVVVLALGLGALGALAARKRRASSGR